MSYSVYLIKATHRPVFVASHNHIDDAIYRCDSTYDNYLLLRKHDLAESGVSVQVISSDNDEKVNQISIGGVDLHKIVPIYSCGGW